MMVKGHYYLFVTPEGIEFREPKSKRTYLQTLFISGYIFPIAPVFQPTPGTKSEESGTRLASVREKGRIRDLRCVLTNIEAPLTMRGRDFTGLEAAHIYPLYAVNKRDWMEGLQKISRWLVETWEAADDVRNVVIMRVDIHRLYDAHKFGILPVEVRKNHFEFKVVVFKKDGALALKGIIKIEIDASHVKEAVQLFKAQLRVGVLRNMKGNGGL
ncbi:hypothetical protein H0H81_010407 [Sphagnurus paluster]|uniref:HNH nuclease domain-containing protein n=1 Tax=Sphagnurus paluster TaxID=117069 RepID=A0A9P7FRI7_9AGAR|nr:hypothetical protein H0H81_010407 [Sphagnurus paluster]